MPLRHIPIKKITERHLQSLINNQISEGKTIDYKREAEKDYREFVRDVSSFANTIGGDIIYGIEDDNSIPKRLAGFHGVNAEEIISKFHQWIQTGVEPVIPGVVVREIDLTQTGGIALVVRIPRSWASPHMVTAQDDCRFWWRHDKAKLMMRVPQVRDAFEFSTRTIERIRDFREQRLSLIAQDETSVALQGRPRIILHVIPMYAFDPSISYDITPNPQAWTLYQMRHSHERYNLDGFIRYRKDEGKPAFWYQQVFRSGIIEFVDASIIYGGTIPSQKYEETVIDELEEILSIQKSMQVDPPLFVMLTLWGVKDNELGVSNLLRRDPQFRGFTGYKIDRNTLKIQEVMINSYDLGAAQILRPLFDAVWNAGGWPRSLNFDANGDWIG